VSANCSLRSQFGPAADEIAATLERAGVTTLATADPDRARSLLDTLRERNPTLPVVVYTGADHRDDLETDAANDHDEVGGGH
jgi:hypothetical protein